MTVRVAYASNKAQAGRSRSKRVLALFTHDFTGEIRAVDAGTTPAHRLFGLKDLAAAGWTSDVVQAPGRRGGMMWRRSQTPAAWRAINLGVIALRQRRWDAVYAVTEAAALPALVLRRMHLLRIPLVLVDVALPRKLLRSDAIGRAWRKLIAGADHIVTYRSDHVAALEALTDRPVTFIPFGVDLEWLRGDPPQERSGSPRLLSVGTNEGKDYATLIRALGADDELVMITDDDNIHRAGLLPAGVTTRTHVPIIELRDLYRNCEAMVIPMREVGISSGQTVLLGNLACGTAIITTEVGSVTDYVEPGRTAILVPEGDVEALRLAITRLKNDPAHRHRLEQGASQAADAFSSATFAARLGSLLDATIEHR